MTAKKLARQQRAVERWNLHIKKLADDVTKLRKEIERSKDPVQVTSLTKRLDVLEDKFRKACESANNTVLNISNRS